MIMLRFLVVALAFQNRTTITCQCQPLPSFPDGSPWQEDISAAPLDPESAETVAWLQANGGWGNGNNLQIDDSIVVLDVDCNTPRVEFSRKSVYYGGSCETDVNEIPVPAIGSLEGTTTDWVQAASCSGDCHLLIHDVDSGMLWESFSTKVTVANNVFGDVVTKVESSCLVVWNTNHVYPSDGRGDGCTSADAAGFPIAPLLFTPDEIHAGSIDHAIRFILPNPRIRAFHYAHPASHFGGPSADEDSKAPIYGSRWRLKPDFDISGYSQPAKVVLRALKKHGMMLSDGGNIALTKASDTFREVTWSMVGLDDPRPFDGITPTDFEIVRPFGNEPRDYGRDIDNGAPNPIRPDCVLNDIPGITFDAVCPGPPSIPSNEPSISVLPSSIATNEPSISALPSLMSSNEPSSRPSLPPTSFPSGPSTRMPSGEPSISARPSLMASNEPSSRPSLLPTSFPSGPSTRMSSGEPSISALPSLMSSNEPSSRPSLPPTSFPSGPPTSVPSDEPSIFALLSLMPSNEPSSRPSLRSTNIPSSPSTMSSDESPISGVPTNERSISALPSKIQSNEPSSQPSFRPTGFSSSPARMTSNGPPISVLPSSIRTNEPPIRPKCFLSRGPLGCLIAWFHQRRGRLQ